MAQQTPQQNSNVVLGIVLFGMGAMILGAQIFGINLISVLWPFFIIIPGILFFVGMVMGGKSTGPLAIPGTIITMTGLILLFQATFNYYLSWVYAWALIFPTSIGLGLMINGHWSKKDELVRHGSRFFSIGMILFLIGASITEFIRAANGDSALLPVLLIGGGLYLIIRQNSLSKVKSAFGVKSTASITEPEPYVVEEAPVREREVEFEPLDMSRS